MTRCISADLYLQYYYKKRYDIKFFQTLDIVHDISDVYKRKKRIQNINMMVETEESRLDPQEDACWIISSTFIIFTMQSGMYRRYFIPVYLCLFY